MCAATRAIAVGLCVIAGVPDSGGARRKLLPGVRFLQSLGQRICGRMEWLPFGYFSIVSIQTCGAAFCAGSSESGPVLRPLCRLSVSHLSTRCILSSLSRASQEAARVLLDISALCWSGCASVAEHLVFLSDSLFRGPAPVIFECTWLLRLCG